MSNFSFTGTYGVLALAILGFSSRFIVSNIASLVRQSIFVRLTLMSSDRAYLLIDRLLTSYSIGEKTRSVVVCEKYDFDRDRWTWGFSPGLGWHFIKFEKRFFIINRASNGSPIGVNGSPSFQLNIFSLGKSITNLEFLVEEAEKLHSAPNLQRVYYYSNGHFQIANQSKKRSIDTVFLPKIQKDRLKLDLTRFIEQRSLYQKRGDPYRRTYLLEGPPGTGKTSLALVLSAWMNKDVYIINLANAQSDDILHSAFNAIGEDGVGLIEDIDTNTVVRSRKYDVNSGNDRVANITASGVTLSGVLNSLDGAAARDGRILFITTNFPDALDKAIVRPGRVDVCEHIGLLDKDVAFEMASHYFPNDNNLRAWFDNNVDHKLPIAASDLRGLLLIRQF